jgi:hypothetical protein
MTGFYRKGQMGSSGSFGGSGNAGGGATDRLYNAKFYNGAGSGPYNITTGMDLTSSGGMILLKSLNVGSLSSWGVFDTERGATKVLQLSTVNYEFTESTSLTGFTSTGFTLGGYNYYNNNATHYIAYTFKKAEKFFDVVTYTGNGSNRTINHNLNCEPGMIWVKKRNGSDSNYGNWEVYHKYGITGGGNAAYYYSHLSNTGSFTADSTMWNNTMPTTTEFSVGTNATVNQQNSTYVAYLFAHDPSASGQIKMGEWSNSASAVIKPNEFGWEADLCMVKTKQNGDPFNLLDYDRGWSLKSSRYLRFSDTNFSRLLDESDVIFAPLEKGFYEGAGKGIAKYYSPSNHTNKTMIYMAIRKGDLDNVGDISGTLTSSDTGAKTVFYPSQSSAGQTPAFLNAELTRTPEVDMAINSDSVITSPSVYTMNRPVGSGALRMSSQSYALGQSSNLKFGPQHQTTAYNANDVGQGYATGRSSDHRGYMWKRAKGFCDIVTYLGDTSATLPDGNSVKTVSHKLNKVPSMIWVKSYLNLNSGAPQLSWFVWSNQLTNNNYALILNANDAESTANGNLWNNTAPTSSAFTVCNVASGAVNLANVLYVAYVFGDVAGVSKVGKYTGAGGSTQVTVDCGFSSGVDFILIKRLDYNGEWYIFDRKNTGINVGNDGAYSWLSSTNTDITYNVTGGDMVEQTTAGFKVMGNSPATINVSGATYLFYAIAKTS